MRLDSANNVRTVNFIHYGDAVNRLVNALGDSPDMSTKDEVLRYLEARGLLPRSIRESVEGYGSPYRRQIDWGRFCEDVRQSPRLATAFRNLGCRGFSFRSAANVGFLWELRKSVNFRFALLSDRKLYYPTRVHRWLPRSRLAHIREDKYPAIGFALGRIVDGDLHLFVLQSDIAFQGPPYLREHFRGWRKILLQEILSYAAGALVNRVLLTCSREVLRTCHPDYKPPTQVPSVWRHIYEGTAGYFGMTKIETPKRINIQTLAELPRCYSRDFYCLDNLAAYCRLEGEPRPGEL